MRIGLFTDSYRPYTSGVVNSIDLFTRDLTNLGHEINIFAPSYKNDGEDARVFRFASVPAPTNREFSLAIPFSLRLRPALKKLKPDIIHVHSPFLLGRLGARYARMHNVPLVFTFHTLYDLYVHYIPFGQDIARELTRRYCREFCNDCDMVITPTEIIAEHLRKHGVKAAIKTIPTGIDLEKFEGQDARWVHRKYNLDDHTRVLLCVGRLGKEKNMGFIIDVFASIHPRYPDTKLVIVGGGPEMSALKKRAGESGVGDNVIFTGTVDKDEVVKYYCSSYLFIFASVTETQGLVLGEAKAAGVPSVAVRAYGVEEMVSDGEDGFLVEPSREEFIEKLELLLNNTELRDKMSEAARLNAAGLSSRATAAKLVESYKEIIEAKYKAGKQCDYK
ncbi:MAG: glycosyl transferase family 1 [Peptococcaceae bacterium BICA1-7]|nr:MAG: glycosyl transferase family 1 [Peptococcaceae bacterium BICA1-7]HBV97818.1 glycosyltransferase family 4 protein [Desulfotomaculum sp.]